MSPRTSSHNPNTSPQGAFYSFQLNSSTAPTDSVPVEDPFHQSINKRPAPTVKKSLVFRINERIDELENSVKAYCAIIDTLPMEKQTQIYDLETSSCDQSTSDSSERELIDEDVISSTVTYINLQLTKKSTFKKTPVYNSLSKNLVSLFFTLDEHFALPRILDIPQFFDIKTRPSYLLNAMYALSSQYSSHQDLAAVSFDVSQYFYDLAVNDIILNLHTPSLELIQTLTILSVVDLIRGYSTKGHLRIGEAIRLAQLLGYNEIDQEDCTLFDDLTNEEKDRIRNLWNILVRIDFGASQFMGRPNFVGVTTLPRLKAAKIKSYEDTQLVISSRSRLPSPVKMYYQQFMGLVKTMWNISSFANSPQIQLNDDCISEIYRCVQAIDHQYNQLPKLLRYTKKLFNSSNFQMVCFAQKIILLYVIFHSAKIYTHLFLFTKSEYTMYFPTMLSMAYNAVISCNGIARILKDFASIQSKHQESKQPNSSNASPDSEPITQFNNPPWFPSSYCQYAGICYIAVLKYIKLLKLHNIPYYQPKDDCPIYLVVNEKNLTKRFSSFIRTMKRFETCWEGTSEFLPMLTSTMESVESDPHHFLDFHFENEAIWGGHIDPWKFMESPAL
ncbi:hypothetical protein CONCODRAFT_77290 [Conidiobolus coronatus NRRL 28638]|uniref:Xylanolytic transcriptional activator regulatory domain-containing protein n=1 Tax=Conidiobolus coronatus (strain ATCC 28846 / CBS 209.66 / NRRL 28638) TaxID=796925 RepID=A0A137PF19_CONC2|nr:hypothetical protein CONCODRAFT_77290 [Conidiobolus coronatus NRRL 28638]|eukprot:KXN73541.1 hypothetical protein CONCODRAFT_77290 [Conidiobolus coronatus NRRL 28638]